MSTSAGKMNRRVGRRITQEKMLGGISDAEFKRLVRGYAYQAPDWNGPRSKKARASETTKPKQLS